jgi:hypothetical protein
MSAPLTRRRFVLTTAAAFAATRVLAQSAHASVATMDHDNILAAAAAALKAQPKALMDVSASIAALTAAFVLTKEDSYAAAAQSQLSAWLPTKFEPTPTIVDLIPIAELARSTSFLVDSFDMSPVNAILNDILQWMTNAHAPVVERDTKDHRASAWLLIASAIARATRNDKVLSDCRSRLRKPTLRNQIDETGLFPQEFASANPYRNTLFNFDLLCGACQLLDAPIDPLWSFELIDGVGLRSAAALLYPVIAERNKWPGIADADHFRDLPGRRPGLLFAGRAYNRPEYVELWRTTPPAIPAALAATFPIRQPILWTTRAAHGL